jgi:hypothetical protein
MSCRKGHFLKESGHKFDAPFFNISKTEVMSMDPQQRLLMESVYEAIENGERRGLASYVLSLLTAIVSWHVDRALQQY